MDGEQRDGWHARRCQNSQHYYALQNCVGLVTQVIAPIVVNGYQVLFISEDIPHFPVEILSQTRNSAAEYIRSQ